MILLAKALEFVLFTKIGQALAAGGLFALLFGGWLLKHDHKVAARTEQRIVEQSTSDGKVRNEKSERVRTNTGKPGALDRLRKDPLVCADCR